MLIGTRQRLNGKALNATYKLHAINSYKYLGVKLDQTLHLAELVNYTFKKALAMPIFFLGYENI